MVGEAQMLVAELPRGDVGLPAAPTELPPTAGPWRGAAEAGSTFGRQREGERAGQGGAEARGEPLGFGGDAGRKRRGERAGTRGVEMAPGMGWKPVAWLPSHSGESGVGDQRISAPFLLPAFGKPSQTAKLTKRETTRAPRAKGLASPCPPRPGGDPLEPSAPQNQRGTPQGGWGQAGTAVGATCVSQHPAAEAAPAHSSGTGRGTRRGKNPE